MPQKQLTILAMHAHPDDETVFTGGTLAVYHDRGVKTVLVLGTHGEEGEIHDPDLDPVEAFPRLGEIRMGEMAGAAEVLGIDVVEYLGYRDSGMVGTEPNSNPLCFHQSDREEATDRLVALIRKYQPEILITYDEFGSYGHPDHIAANQITTRAWDLAGDASYKPELGVAWEPQKLYWTHWNSEGWEKAQQMYKERGLKWPFDREEEEKKDEDPERLGGEEEVVEAAEAAEEEPHYMPPPVTARIDVLAGLERKSAAISKHRTQFAPDGPFNNMPLDIAELAVGQEHYSLIKSRLETPELEDDLLIGLQ